MNFFKRKSKPSSNAAIVQTAPTRSKNQHPYPILNNYSDNTTQQWKLYRSLKEAVPIIDAAISKIIKLTGEFKIDCDDPILQEKINKFISNIQVNSCAIGANSFILSFLNQLLTYGTAIGEIVINSSGNDIAALYNAPLENTVLSAGESPLQLKIHRKRFDGSLVDIKYPELILISSLSPDPGRWPSPTSWSPPWTAPSACRAPSPTPIPARGRCW
ncbi:MAG: hypothetical protein IKE05_01000, partial [Clostridia bacterium]|nr:hypothetical protein [Clostridia bacterium]